MRLIRIVVAGFLLTFGTWCIAQVTIADALPGCLQITDAEAVECQMSGSFQFEVVGNQFVANNSDGTDCNCPSDFGNNNAYFEFETVDISSYMNVSIMFSYSAAATAYEDDSPGAPIVGCSPTPFVNNSHDQIVFYYSLNGGPYILGEYIHGTSQADFTGAWNETGLNGNTLKIKVVASNKAAAEIFYFQNLIIKGDPKTISAGPDKTTCDTNPVNLMGSGTGTWTGGDGTFNNVNSPTSTYTPAASEAGSTVTLTYSGNPGTGGCASAYPPPSDEMEIDVNSGPNASVSGGGEICQGECTVIDINVTGGVEPFTLSFTINGFPVNNVPGFSYNDQINVCLLESNFPFPNYVQATNTLELPASFAGTTINFVFTSISDNSGCPGTVDNTPLVIDLLDKPQATPFTLEECDEGGGIATFDLNDAVFDILGSETGVVHFYSDAGLTNEEFSPYVSASTILYAVIEGNNGCWSEPVELNLEVLAPGNVAPVSITCDGAGNCSICDTDGILGADATVQINLPSNQGYIVEISYLMNSVTTTFTQSVNGPLDDIIIPVDADAIVTLISVTAAGECPDVSGLGPVVNISYDQGPLINNAVSLSSCDEVILPPINVTNPGATTAYFTGPGGTGTQYNPGAVINSTIQLYAFSGNSTCFDEEGIVVSIGGTTSFDNQSDTSSCGGLVLPTITGNNVSGNASYFTQINGGGQQFKAGDVINSSATLYIYDASNPNCLTNQPSFEVTITPAPQIKLDSIVKECTSYKLPKITGTNLAGNEAYYSNPLFTGTPDSVGTVVSVTDTFYLFVGNAQCSDKDTLLIQIQPITTYNVSTSINACNAYELPIISGANVGVNASYYTDTIPGAIEYNAGDIITGPIKLFVYDTTSFCESNQPELNINVSPGPEIFDIADTAVCQFFVLPPISGISLSGAEAYYDSPGGNGNSFMPGDTIKTSLQIFAFEGNPACQAEQPFVVTVDQLPKAGNPLNVQICLSSNMNFDLYNLLSGNYDVGGTWTQIGPSTLDLTDPENVLLPDTLKTNLYGFRYVVDGGACNASVSLPNAIIIQNPSAGLDSIAQVCEGSTSPVNLFDLLRGATSQGGVWISNLSNPNPFAFDASALAQGDYQFSYALTNRYAPTNSSCSDTSKITLRVVDGLQAGLDVNAGQVCAGSTINLVNALQNNNDTGQFINQSNGATISNPSNYQIPTGSSGSLSFLHILPATGGCEADSAIINFSITARPDAGNDNGDDYCGTQTIELLSLVDDGTLNGNFVSNGNNIPIVNKEINPTNGGNYNFFYIVSNGNVCPPDTANISVSFTPTPQLQLTGNPKICFGDEVTFSFNLKFSNLDPFVDVTFNIVTDADFQNGITTGNQVKFSVGGGSTSYTYFNSASALPVGIYHIIFNEVVDGQCTFDAYGGNFEIDNGGSKIINSKYCSDEVISLYGNNYSINNSKDTLLISGGSGCDSTIFIDLQFSLPAQSNVNLPVCEGKSVLFNGQSFSAEGQGGQIILQNQSASGCDSIVNVSINKLLNSNSVYNFSTCNTSYQIQFGNEVFNASNPSGSALLNVRASNGCDSIVNVSLNFSAPETTIDVENALCSGDNGQAIITGTDLNGTIGVLVDGRAFSSVTAIPTTLDLPSGDHTITLTDDQDCTTENQISIDVEPSPIVNINEVTQQDGSKRLIITSDTPLTNISWMPSGSVDCDNCDEVLVLEYGNLRVSYSFGLACVDSLNYTVFENVKEEIYFPNIINPGGTNGIFYPQKPDGYQVIGASLDIFDRWGNKVFHNENFAIGDPDQGWNGKFNGNRLNPGVFVFALQVIDANGKTKYFTGDITLVE